MPTKHDQQFTGVGLYDMDGNKLMDVVDFQENPEINPMDDPSAEERELMLQNFKDMSFQMEVITKPECVEPFKRLLDKLKKKHDRQIRRAKRKQEKARRNLLKTFGLERYRVIRRATLYLYAQAANLHESDLPIRYEDGGYLVEIGQDENGIYIHTLEIPKTINATVKVV